MLEETEYPKIPPVMGNRTYQSLMEGMETLGSFMAEVLTDYAASLRTAQECINSLKNTLVPRLEQGVGESIAFDLFLHLVPEEEARGIEPLLAVTQKESALNLIRQVSAKEIVTKILLGAGVVGEDSDILRAVDRAEKAAEFWRGVAEDAIRCQTEEAQRYCPNHQPTTTTTKGS